MKNLIFGLVLIFLAVSIIFTTFSYINSITGRIIERSPYLSTVGFSPVYVDVDSENIYLTSGCNQLVMVTNELQTYSIASGLQNLTGERPGTHDLMKDTFELYDIRVLMVKIDNFRGETYYAKLLLQQGNRILNLDSRPSDAIAIAVRFSSPIYVKNEIMTMQGKRIC
jgi:bifunctional DNase/RNase